MKYIALVLASFFCLTTVLAQQNNSFDQAKNLHLTLQKSSSANDFISELIDVDIHPNVSFFTAAVFVDAPFSGNLQYQINGAEWQSLERYHEATRTDRAIFELIFLPNESITIKFKSDQNIDAGLSVRSLTLASTKLLNDPIAQLQEDCNCTQPEFCGRNCWCPTGDCPTDATPVATAPTHIIVHHSASASMSNDFPAVVRSYWDFHVNVNGWDDIGYNWLIDGEGVIYEGRGSGTQGAHFSCMNNQTTGICMIGNFENSTPTQAAITSLENLIAWEACDKTIVPGGSSNHITSGSLLNHISGHRDGNDLPNSCTNTVCPGANLYPLLQGIRERVTDKACLNDLVDVEDIEQPNFQIFPNPSYGYFQLSGDLNQIAALNIYSQTGQQIAFKFNQNGSLALRKSGLYFLKIMQKNGAAKIHKLIVQPAP